LRPQKCRQVELLRGELFTQGMVSGVAWLILLRS
jgi:hypothetical protein